MTRDEFYDVVRNNTPSIIAEDNIMAAFDKCCSSQNSGKPIVSGPKAEPACGGDCGMSYCDEYGCIDAKATGVEPCPPPEAGA